MGLWLKCPGCQAVNPLSLKVCPNCGQDLDNLSVDQRVYVIGPKPAPPAPSPQSTKEVVATEPAPAPAQEPAAAKANKPESEAAFKPAKKPRAKKTTKKKKS
jgi:hypothetical protein